MRCKLKKSSILILTIFGLLLLCSGCKNDRLENNQNVQPYYLLTENNCSFPCWMGIIPGETSYPELKEIFDQLVRDYAKKGVTITYTEQPAPVKHIDQILYIYAKTPGSEMYIILDGNIVKEIKIIFLNTPTVAEFAENYKVPDSIGICLSSSRARPILFYDGALVFTKTGLLNIDEITGLVSIEDFYLDRVDEVRLKVIPEDNLHFDFTFDWEDMSQNVLMDINEINPNSDCFGRFIP